MAEYNAIAKRYEDDVLSGKIPAGKLLRLAIERQRKDLQTGHKRGLIFDHDAGQDILDFAELVNIAPEKQIRLAPSQVWELYVFYGWKRDDGRRRYRFKYKSCARGNGKTPLESLQVLYHLVVDGPDKAEVYVSATKEDQAKIAFNDAKNMLEFSPDLQEDLSSSAETVFNLSNKSKFSFLTSNPKTADGTRPTFAIIDEYHEFDNDDMLVKLKTGLIKTTNPILNIVTTRGANKAGPCYQAEVNFYIPILKGTISNDATFVLIYSLDEEDIKEPEGDKKGKAPWKDKRNWQKANPMLGHLLRVDDMAEAMKEAVQKGGRTLVGFKTLNLNIWEESELTWIEAEKWADCAGKVDPAALRGQLCYAGLDLATKHDFNAFVLAFPLDDGRFKVLTRFWVPEDTVPKYEAKGVDNIRQWVADGHVRTTPGNYVDYDQILADILEDFGQFELNSIAKDAWNSAWMYQQLNSQLEPVYRDGKYIERVSDFSQTIKNMTSPTVYLEDLVDEGKLIHDNNPVMAWMMANVVLETTGKEIEDPITGKPQQARKPSKLKSQKKIDGAVALVMALGEYLTWNWAQKENTSDHYETYGIRSI